MLLTQLAELLKAKQYLLASAESCTGGLLASYCTSLPGSSNWFDCALITYSNAAKQRLLGVSKETLAEHGAVSEACALAMVDGLIKNSQANIGVAITGIAGPDGGSAEKPVGTVWFGFAIRGQAAKAYLKNFSGDRQAIRQQACEFAIAHLTTMLQF